MRRALFAWLLPASLVLPVWLVVGWVVFSGSGLTLLSVLAVMAPAVFVGELLITLMIRLRFRVRQTRAVSWQDALGIIVWHGLVVAIGCYLPASGLIVVCAIAAFFALFWSSMWQLRQEARGTRIAGPFSSPLGREPTEEDAGPRGTASGPVIVVHESGTGPTR